MRVPASQRGDAEQRDGRRRRRAAAARAGSRILATSVSVSASAAQRTASAAGRSASCHHDARRVRRKICAASTSTSQWRAAAAHCRYREVAAGVLEQRALVDHRQLEVRVGVVDGLAAGLGDHDERERDRAERERRARPDLGPGGAGDHPAQVGRRRRRAPQREREDERRLDEDRERQVAARAHQREAVRRRPTTAAASAKRASASNPASASTSWPTPQFGARVGDGNEQHGAREARRDDRGRQPVDGASCPRRRPRSSPRAAAARGRAGAGSARGGPGAAPSSAGRAREAAARAAMPPTSWAAPAAAVAALIRSAPIRAAASRTTTSADQVGDVRPEAAALQSPRVPRPRRARRRTTGRYRRSSIRCGTWPLYATSWTTPPCAARP